MVGFHGGFVFADNLREARVMLAANRGVMPIEGVGAGEWFGSTLKRIPLLRGRDRFASLLEEQFQGDT